MIAWEGEVKVFENGRIEGAGACKEYRAGQAAQDVAPPVGSGMLRGGEFVVLGERFELVVLPNNIKGAKQINKEIKNIVTGGGTPRLNDDGITQKVFENRRNTVNERKWAGALEYEVRVPDMGNAYRILKLSDGVDAAGNPIYKYGYSWNHYKDIREFKLKIE